MRRDNIIRFPRRRRWRALRTPLTVVMFLSALDLYILPVVDPDIEPTWAEWRAVPRHSEPPVRDLRPDPDSVAVRVSLRPMARGDVQDARSRHVMREDPADKPRVLRGGRAWGGAPFVTVTPSAKATVGGRTIKGRVTHVRDGDTIEVAPMAVRLAKLDCAERGTAQGNRATRLMRQLAAGQRVSCRLSGDTSYDRHVGTCALQDGRDLGNILLAERLCTLWH